MHRARKHLLTASVLVAVLSGRLFAGPAVTASSESEGNAAVNAYDRNRSSRWSSEFSDPQWLEMDFGEKKDLVGVLLFWEAAFGSSYEISCSEDGQTWKSVFRTDQGDGGTDEIFFERTHAQFLRISCTRRGTAWGYSLFEVVPRTAAEPWGEGEVPDLLLLAPPSRVFVPGSWSNENPILWLTGYRNKLELSVNGLAIRSFEDVGPRQRVDVKTALRYDDFNEISLQTDALESRASALLVANEQALNRWLRQVLARDAKTCFGFLAGIEPEGLFPYYLTGKQGYWTVVGAPGDFRESLFSEEGVVEPYKSFSVHPFLSLEGKLLTREDARITQSLEDGFLPMPTVQWDGVGYVLIIRALAAGAPSQSVTYVSYAIRNTGDQDLSGQLHLAIRPFEVNPPWQWGGLHRVPSIAFRDNTVFANDYSVISLSPVTRFAKCGAESIEIVQDLSRGTLAQGVAPDSEYSSAALSYDFTLPPAGETNIWIAIPLHPGAKPDADVRALSQSVAARWRTEIPAIPFYCPEREIMDTVKASLAYILVNRDGPAIQPGSRAYEAAWMRDGAMTSGALLRYGMKDIVREFLDWYAGYIMDDGRIPAIVIIGRNEVNPVKEFDSQGEFVHACWDYFRFSSDRDFLERTWPRIDKALRFLAEIRRGEADERRKESLDQARYYGILPKCVSHEGYYPEPGNHSYWDDFWGLKGWKDAASTARVLGRTNQLEWIASEERALREATYNSIGATREFYKLDYLPGCAELGDFDPSSTAIAVTTCDELYDLPQPALTRTFEKYLEGLRKRRDPGWQGSFSPYEFRIAQALVMMGRPHDAWAVFNYLMTCRMPVEWRQWPEAVYFPVRTPGYIGDMPHTWAASGFLNAFRSMYLYEDEAKGRVVLAAGLPIEWVTSNETWFVTNAATCWGPVSYSMRRDGETIAVQVSGACDPPGGILFNPMGGTRAGPVVVTNLPATLRLEMTDVDTHPAVVEYGPGHNP